MPAVDIATQLNNLIIYRNLLQDKLVQKIQLMLAGNAKPELVYELSAGLVAKAEELGLEGDLWQSYVAYLLARDENTFSATVDKTRGNIGSGLSRAVLHDLSILRRFLCADVAACGDISLISGYIPSGPGGRRDFMTLANLLLATDDFPPEKLVAKFIEYYTVHGCGKTAGFAAFRWDESSGLVGIKHFDSIRMEDIVGYESQKEVLIKNSEAFLSGKPANNVLLVGARGTGKSSSVKGLVNRYFPSGLRLIEVHKHQLQQLPKILDSLRSRSQKFIVFLDDLSFEETEIEYKHLKSVIDGGVEALPDNVLLYATSNRRHLIRETWADRAGGQDIHAAESVQEKISLSDRFGITLSFQAPNQDEYLRIVEALATRQNIDLPQEELKKQALRWEMSHSGRSGRLAKQFIKHIMSNT